MPRHLLCFFSLTAFLSSPVYSSEYELGMYIGRYHFSNPNDDIQYISDTFKKPINLSINIGKYYPINNQQNLVFTVYLIIQIMKKHFRRRATR